MNSLFVPALLFYYGVFLIMCGVASVILIGLKAKTALVSGGISGVIMITIGHFISQGSSGAQAAGLLVCFTLFMFSVGVLQRHYLPVRVNPRTSSGFKGQGYRIPHHKPHGSRFGYCSFAPVVVDAKLVLRIKDTRPAPPKSFCYLSQKKHYGFLSRSPQMWLDFYLSTKYSRC